MRKKRKTEEKIIKHLFEPYANELKFTKKDWKVFMARMNMVVLYAKQMILNDIEIWINNEIEEAEEKIGKPKGDALFISSDRILRKLEELKSKLKKRDENH
jgi:hypothetical protein